MSFHCVWSYREGTSNIVQPENVPEAFHILLMWPFFFFFFTSCQNTCPPLRIVSSIPYRYLKLRFSLSILIFLLANHPVNCLKTKASSLADLVMWCVFIDIVQDVASKGLGLVYDCGDEESRHRLVNQLLDQLASGRRTVAQVTSDTKLFEEGALGKTPTG